LIERYQYRVLQDKVVKSCTGKHPGVNYRSDSEPSDGACLPDIHSIVLRGA
jgi:hypothetical protein